MKLDRETFLEALGHEDFYVRSRIFTLLAEPKRPEIEVTWRSMAAVDRFGWENAFEWTHDFSDLALDERSIEWLFEQAERRDEGAPDAQMKGHLLSWFATAPDALLKSHFDRMQAHPLAGKGHEIFYHASGLSSIEQARFRLKLMEQPTAEAKAILDEVVTRCAGHTGDFPFDEVGKLRLVTKYLAAHGDGEDSSRQVLEWLALKPNGKGGEKDWRIGAAILWAGELSLEAAVPRLIELFQEDWDFYNEEIQTALVNMASPCGSGKKYKKCCLSLVS